MQTLSLHAEPSAGVIDSQSVKGDAAVGSATAASTAAT
jgi:hypothetical protein